MVYTLEDDLTNFQETMSSLDVDLLHETINGQINSLESNMTWHLVGLSLDYKLIGCKWIFKKKLKTYETIDQYKACLIAKCFRQGGNLDSLTLFC
jgi:hypothetical protein